MPLDETCEQGAQPVGEAQAGHELLLGDEPVAAQSLEMSGGLACLATCLDEALSLLLRRVSVGAFGDERLGARGRADDW